MNCPACKTPYLYEEPTVVPYGDTYAMYGGGEFPQCNCEDIMEEHLDMEVHVPQERFWLGDLEVAV